VFGVSKQGAYRKVVLVWSELIVRCDCSSLVSGASSELEDGDEDCKGLFTFFA